MADNIQRLPQPGEKWLHHSGRPYTVICVTNTEALDPIKFPVTVVYADAEHRVWSRPAHTFVKKFSRVQ